MSHMEHGNKQKEHLQSSNGLDAVMKFIKMNVVNQDNSQMQVKGTKVTDKFKEAWSLPASETLSRIYHHIHMSSS